MLTFQLSALLLFISIVVCWLLLKKINVNNYKIFNSLLVVTGVSIVLDMIPTYLSSENIVNETVQQYIFKAFLIFLVFTAYLYFSYLISKSISAKYIVKYSQYSIYAPIIDGILIIFLPISINQTSTGLDITGEAMICAYACAFVYVLLIIVLLIFAKKRINRWYRICFIAEAILWTTAVIVQFLIQQTGVISIAFACSIASVFIFAENPLNYTNLNYNCFKNNYLSTYLNNVCNTNDDCYVMAISIENETTFNSDYETVESYKRNIIKEFNNIKSFKTFINENEEIFAICENNNKYDQIKEYFENLLKDISSNDDQIKTQLIVCKNVKLFNHSDDAIFYIEKVINNFANVKEPFISYEISDEEIFNSNKEETIKEEIVKALDNDRLEAFVQPIYSVAKQKVVAAESLARIRNRDGSFMLPYQFIPVSEKCGLDIQIGYRMIEKVCKYLADPATSSLFESIDINLSIAQCEQADLANRIITMTQSYNVAPNRINFEITESGFINEMSNIEKNIKLLTKYGFGFSLDDFGSGESNLDYLVKMPVKYIKLDMHMIWAYFENERARKVVKSVIKISHDMNLKVIAEGVETKEQLDELSNQGVDFIQGYYIYKPMQISDYIRIVIENRSKVTVQKQAEVINSVYYLSSIFLTMHLINFEENTVQEFNIFSEAHIQSSVKLEPQVMMNETIKKIATQKWLPKVLEFVDLSTLNERLKDNNFISLEFEGSVRGWEKAYFVSVNYDKNGKLIRVWFLTQFVDDDKRRIEMLEVLSKTDELTSLFNRRSYDLNVEKLTKNGIPDDLVLVYGDVNSLKYTNDNIGHMAGDELIKSAANSLNNALSKFGKVFRTGGDEFIAILNGDKQDIQNELNKMKKHNDDWKGEYTSHLSIATGMATIFEVKDKNISELEKLAESRMYEEKTEYYVESNQMHRNNAERRHTIRRKEDRDRYEKNS